MWKNRPFHFNHLPSGPRGHFALVQTYQFDEQTKILTMDDLGRMNGCLFHTVELIQARRKASASTAQ